MGRGVRCVTFATEAQIPGVVQLVWNDFLIVLVDVLLTHNTKVNDGATHKVPGYGLA